MRTINKEWNRQLDNLQEELMPQETRSEDGQLLVTLMLRIVYLLGRLEPAIESAASAPEARS